MINLELYLSENFVKEKEQKKSVSELIDKVMPTYEKFYDDKGWPYVFGDDPTNISTSTTAMVAFSMSVLMYGKPDLVIHETRKDLLKHYEKMDEDLKENFKQIFNKSLKLLFHTVMNIRMEWTKGTDERTNIETIGKDKFTFESTTYGNDDPFTLMWTRYLVDNNNDSLKDLENFEEIKKAFDEKCLDLVSKIFEKLYTDKSELCFSSKMEKFHIFPLLKIVQLYYNMTPSNKFCVDLSDEEKNKYINEVRNVLKNSLHHHLSLANIENSNFDAAELVFSLEGMLLLDPNRDNFDQKLLDRVFEVVKQRQKISLYWRPLKPFVSNKQGLALLPLSVEIAMSLIRICRLLDKRGEKLFSTNYEMFEKYTEWVKTRVSVVFCGAKECTTCKTEANCSQNWVCNHNKFYGWCSEHIYQPDVIHPWETSQVMVYLVNFIDMLQKHIAYQSFKFANLSIKNWSLVEGSWSKWEKSEPVTQERVYEDIGEYYIKSDNCYSMLLYGPPGTGKSTIAEEIAKAKGWPLVTITPSDFIANGPDQVETKAKSIFKVLEEQEEMVVLFDEIDRLILDRDSSLYQKQSDLFQFMTPSMLVKLKDLRTKGKIIFIIATNYEERIDMAIKRTGRIDQKFLVLPPDKSGRNKLFGKFIIGSVENSEFIECKEFVLNKTAFYTFTEFKQLCQEINDLIIDGKLNIDELKQLIKKPAITLMSYEGKLGTTNDESNTQKPVKEFLSLVFLKAETYDATMNVDSVLNENEQGLLINLLCSKEMFGKKLNLILGDQGALEDKLKEHTHKKMAEKIVKLLNGIKPVRNQRGGRK